MIIINFNIRYFIIKNNNRQIQKGDERAKIKLQ